MWGVERRIVEPLKKQVGIKLIEVNLAARVSLKGSYE